MKKNDRKARDNLAGSLTEIDTFVIFRRNKDDERPIIESIPATGVAARVIHKRYMIDESNTSLTYKNNICIECTLIKPGLVEHDLYTKALFSPSPVMSHIFRSTSNIFVSQL